MKYLNIELHNASGIEETDGKPGVRVTRLPLEMLPEVNPGVQGNTWHTTACEIRGMLTSGGKARVVLQVEDDNIVPPIAEVWHGCIPGETKLLSREPTEITIQVPPKAGAIVDIHEQGGYPFSPSLVRVRLPHLHPCRIVSIEGDLAYPEAGTTPATTMLAYGSSITHGAHAVCPSGTYAAQAARHLGVDLVNLGFGGSAHMDPAIAEHIASRDDWDFATLEMGINVRNWPTDKFYAAVDNFVSTIVKARPDKHVFCMDLFTNDADFTGDKTLAPGFRDAVKEIAGKQASDKVIYVDGRDILTDPTGLRPDLVHPSDDGMCEMGANLARIVRSHRGQ